VLIFGMMFATFISASIAIRSSFVMDQVVFGAATLGLFLRIIIRMVLPAPSPAAVINGFASLAWTLAAVCTLLYLISMTSRNNEKRGVSRIGL
jgi:hypothetical protein